MSSLYPLTDPSWTKAYTEVPQWMPCGFQSPVLSEVNKAEIADKLNSEKQVPEQVFAIFVVDLILMELDDHRRQQTFLCYSHIWGIKTPGIDPEGWWTWPPGNDIPLPL